MAASRLRVGELNRRLSICQKTAGSDGHGGQVYTWPEIAVVWAEAISQNGREAVIAGTLTGVSSWRIRIRWRADLGAAGSSTDFQLRLDGRVLNIRASDDPDGRREQLVIFADTAGVEI